MKYIIDFFTKFISKEYLKPLGRWKIDYCITKINTKIDLSNEDHCGSCGEYAKTKIDLKNNKILSDNIKNNKTLKNTIM